MSSEKERTDEPDGMVPEEALQWLAGDTDPTVEGAVRAWVASAPDRQEALDELAAIWSSTGMAGDSGDWEDLEARLDAVEIGTARAPRRSRWGALRIAALLILGLGIGLLIPELRQAGTPERHATVVVPPGSHAEILLPGGVKVDLNHASELSYAPSRNVREVRLSGEAYFSVPDGSRRNLLVHTQAGTVRDLGTEFNVRARSGRTSVAVTDGRVRLESAAGAVALVAGQESSVAAGGKPEEPGPARLDAVLAWRTGELTFYDASLARVAEELAHRYGLAVEVSPNLKGTRITAKIMRGASAEEALRGICLSVQAKCDRTDDGWLISRP